jgi:hypothetical protein
MALPTFKVRHHAQLTAPRRGDVRVCASIGPAGEAVAVWTAAEDLPAVTARTVTAGGASFADTRASRPVTVRVTVHAPDIVFNTPIAGLELAHLTILLAGSRCRWRDSGPERNAVTYGTDGQALAEEVLGDGIEHLLVDSAGNVWAGYFDEGVYGNNGWGHPGPPPLGSCGLARFSPSLRDARRYDPADSAFGDISDCYALNIDGITAWACYYTGFPLVRPAAGTCHPQR